METRLFRDISHYTGLIGSGLTNLINKAPYSYKSFKIPKSSTGFRTISQPTRETKALQYALIDLLFIKLPIHEISYAYRPIKSPIRKVANLHKDTSYTLKIDFKDFFPSIRFEDLKKYLELNDTYELNEADLEAIKKICFLYKDKDWILSIGAPSSPIISNIVMYDMDTSLQEIAIKVNKDSKITRYADDIAFSSNRKDSSEEFLDLVKELLEETDSPNLELNPDKTFYLSRANRRKITGLIITPDGKVSIGRSKKRKIKSLVNSFKYGLLTTPEEIYQLQGYLNFIRDVEPAFYTRLIVKYTAETIDSIYKS